MILRMPRTRQRLNGSVSYKRKSVEERANTDQHLAAVEAEPEEVGQLLAKHHGKFACALPIGFIHALTSAK